MLLAAWRLSPGFLRFRWVGLFTLLPIAAAACAPAEPARWPQGGSPLAIAPARWDRAHDDTVELRENGQLLIDGDLVFVLDRVGRVTDDDYEPFAVLLPDGQLAGVENRSLGRVGVTNASPPGAVEAWLQVAPDGRVTFFGADGDRQNGGVFHGCGGAMLRTCTLVAQLVALRSYDASPPSGLSIGVGVGFGF